MAESLIDGTGSAFPARVFSDNSLSVRFAGGTFTAGAYFDYCSGAYPSSTQEVFTFKSGGAGGATVATLTVNYVDTTKESISTVTRT